MDWELTHYLAGLLQIEIDARQVEDGRDQIAGLFEQSSAGREETDETEETSTAFLKAMASPIFAMPLFHHLWFLWFLCWLVLVFALYARFADWLQWQGPPKWLVLSPVRFLYLIPLTIIPQSLMGLVVSSFGPDTSTGLLPMPHVLLYYAPLFLFWRTVFRLRRPRRPSREMVVAGPSLGAVYRLPARARIFNGGIWISREGIRSGDGPGRSGGIAGYLRLDDDLWVHRLVPQTLHPRKQNHSLCVGFVVLAVRDARTAGHWCSNWPCAIGRLLQG